MCVSGTFPTGVYFASTYYFSEVCTQIALLSPIFIVLTPHKRPHVPRTCLPL